MAKLFKPMPQIGIPLLFLPKDAASEEADRLLVYPYLYGMGTELDYDMSNLETIKQEGENYLRDIFTSLNSVTNKVHLTIQLYNKGLNIAGSNNFSGFTVSRFESEASISISSPFGGSGKININLYPAFIDLFQHYISQKIQYDPIDRTINQYSYDYQNLGANYFSGDKIYTTGDGTTISNAGDLYMVWGIWAYSHTATIVTPLQTIYRHKLVIKPLNSTVTNNLRGGDSPLSKDKFELRGKPINGLFFGTPRELYQKMNQVFYRAFGKVNHSGTVDIVSKLPELPLTGNVDPNELYVLISGEGNFTTTSSTPDKPDYIPFGYYGQKNNESIFLLDVTKPIDPTTDLDIGEYQLNELRRSSTVIDTITMNPLDTDCKDDIPLNLQVYSNGSYFWNRITGISLIEVLGINNLGKDHQYGYVE